LRRAWRPAITSAVSAVELLAPAKDLETGIAAIDCGADAVYVGAGRFSAREAAGNSLADIAALARHAHRYWARVYAAVNTILRDDELDAALRLCHDLHGAGVDGLILQDVGLLECDLPPLPLIASTQMHNHTPERVAFLEKVGFARAILARELDLDGIRAIRRATAIELEVFIFAYLGAEPCSCQVASGRGENPSATQMIDVLQQVHRLEMLAGGRIGLQVRATCGLHEDVEIEV
jgi:collagenase-like PrtC family protease